MAKVNCAAQHDELIIAADRGARAFEQRKGLKENPFYWGANPDPGGPLGGHLHTAWNDGWLVRQAEMCASGERSYAGGGI